MPNYKVKRTFPSGEVLTRGKIVVNPKWRNIAQLLREGYIEEATLEQSEEFSPDSVLPIFQEDQLPQPAEISYSGTESAILQQNLATEAPSSSTSFLPATKKTKPKK